MTLRLRLTLAALAVTLPMGLLLLWYDTAKQHDVAEQLLAELIEWRMTTEHARCEAAPESFGGLLARADMPSGPRGGPAPPPEDRAPPPQPDDLPPSPPPRHRDGPRRAHGRTPTIFAYDENLQSRNPNAPVIPKELVDAIRTRDVATSPFGFRSSTVEVLVALSGRTGPCAYVLARGTTNPEWGIFPESNLWVLPTIAVFAAMLLVLGPVVRRIQKLTLAVRRSANSEYASAIVEDEKGDFHFFGEEVAASVDQAMSAMPNTTLERLGSENVSERCAAVAELPRLGGEDAYTRISAAFDDPSEEVRSAAARALFNFQADRAAAFTRALREAPVERRRRIGSAIASSGLASEAISHLTGESREKTYDAFSLLFLMSKAGEVQPLLRAIEEHSNIEVRLAVVKLLALSGQHEILPAFRRLAVRGSLPPEVRSSVMEAIYQISSQGTASGPVPVKR